ncbi:hypothetical protein RD792_005892 [Penstemon davidsonii]|uniref:Leucine-rich repeat-containing N-terminal plant-type domain-containing protein n=1 Tax=Penstemon davidsonii TaxID=160366 RepID=A0ABR0DDZ4_9LAMI|nr:hypothetical protein RD792_005892 [Penstemon davidsonii]
MSIEENIFFKLLILLTSLLLASSSTTAENASRIRCSERERRALLKFKEELVDEYGRLSSWGEEEEEDKLECCKWRGVHCHNRTNRVTLLDLHTPSKEFQNGIITLRGNISTSLLELQHLQYIDLSSNDFHGAPIPNFISSFSKLRHLNLPSSSFSGMIPRLLGNISTLRVLDLKYNFGCYSKNLDWVSHLHSLEYLDLSFTLLSNANNWLQALSKLTSIKEVHLRNSDLRDIHPSSLPLINASTSSSLSILDLSLNRYLNSTLTLPKWFSNFSSSSLTLINFKGNSMTGTIPDAYENMISLTHLDLGSAELEGGVPKYFGNMSSLRYLDVSKNKLSGELFELMLNLSGPVDRKLRYLDLGNNCISGRFPNMSRFSFLTELKLRKNQSNESIQKGYLQLPYLAVLDLSSNRIEGPVPDLSSTPSLKHLMLNKNMFNGALTESIGCLSNLEVFWIGSNLLEGMMTEAHMLNLSRLRVLDLSFNSLLTVKCNSRWYPPFQLNDMRLAHCKLGPNFPTWLKTQNELVYIDISDTGISDVIPSWFGGVAPRLQYLNASNNEIYGFLPNISASTFNVSVSSPPSSGMILDLSRNKISGSINFLCHSKE